MTRLNKQPGPPSAAQRSAGAASRPARQLDPISRDWIARLRADGRVREEALAELHALLVKAARYGLAQRASHLGREGFDDLAVEAADDALVSVLRRLDDYRGESRFTTWAWKFAFYEACIAIRKRRWLGREVPVENAGWDRLSREATPDAQAETAELLLALRRAVDTSLTRHQRRVFVALALNQVPVDVLAARLATTRGALYKTLHEARRRVRAELAADGLGPDGWGPVATVASRFATVARSRR